MGCTQSVWPLWAAMISFSRQIGLLGAVQGVRGTGLGDQLNQILASSWAKAGASAARPKAPASIKLRNFMKFLPQTPVLAHVLAGKTMSAMPGPDNWQGERKESANACRAGSERCGICR